MEEPQGLSSSAAKDLLVKFGPNSLPENPPPSRLSILLAQLKSPLVYILLVAGIITYILNEISDSIIIFLAVLVNTVLGYVQENRASRALSALKKLVHPSAQVIRDGVKTRVDASTLVPGA